MRRIRVIPALLLKDGGLVKTQKFKDSTYVGDPINAVKIFNEKEVDELVFLDITATRQKRAPSLDRIGEIASECFMPLGYGGGITKLSEIKAILNLGVEKVILNSSAFANRELVTEASRQFGSQSVVVSMDVKKGMLGGYSVMVESGNRKTGKDPVEYAKEMEAAGCGEILLNSIDRDGMYTGYDIEMLKKVSSAVSVPVIACGGARDVNDFLMAVRDGGASAVSAGSMFVFHGKQRGVLINFPEQKVLTKGLFELIQ
ncbi:MAG: imidazole glycerol phosphate synthase subunit HisF [Verrucomicrobiales bacterium]|nr:imidazole glycerol phosphate synthase subunit HisF [Verrucomicrobiales bacterium]